MHPYILDTPFYIAHESFPKSCGYILFFPSYIMSLGIFDCILAFFSTALLVKFTSAPSKGDEDGKCELVGTFSLLTQAFLGLLCLLSLIVKRFYEYPLRRTWKVWFFDVSKQVIGAFGVHVFNVLLSILKALPEADATQRKGGDTCDGDECGGDPCDWYFLSIVLDCTIGVYVLYVVLSGVSHVCKRYIHMTDIESGDYGPDPRKPSVKAYFKQLGLYFGSLMITKFILYGFVECFETQLLWITSHILLAWLDEYPNEVEIFIVMFVVPVFMNCLQLILVDNFIQNQFVHDTNIKLHRDHMRGVDDEELEREFEGLVKSHSEQQTYNSCQH